MQEFVKDNFKARSAIQETSDATAEFSSISLPGLVDVSPVRNFINREFRGQSYESLVYDLYVLSVDFIRISKSCDKIRELEKSKSNLNKRNTDEPIKPHLDLGAYAYLLTENAGYPRAAWPAAVLATFCTAIIRGSTYASLSISMECQARYHDRILENAIEASEALIENLNLKSLDFVSAEDAPLYLSLYLMKPLGYDTDDLVSKLRSIDKLKAVYAGNEEFYSKKFEDVKCLLTSKEIARYEKFKIPTLVTIARFLDTKRQSDLDTAINSIVKLDYLADRARQFGAALLAPEDKTFLEFIQIMDEIITSHPEEF